MFDLGRRRRTTTLTDSTDIDNVSADFACVPSALTATGDGKDLIGSRHERPELKPNLRRWQFSKAKLTLDPA